MPVSDIARRFAHILCLSFKLDQLLPLPTSDFLSSKHQRDYYLTERHGLFSVLFKNDPRSLPRILRKQRRFKSSSGKLAWKIILALIMFVLFVLGLLFKSQIDSFGKLVMLAMRNTRIEIISDNPDLYLASETSPWSPTFSPKPPEPPFSIHLNFTSTPPINQTSLGLGVGATRTITRIPSGLGTLIGINHIFKVHRVKQGESLSLLADEKNTTIAAISAINYHTTTLLWIQQIVISASTKQT